MRPPVDVVVLTWNDGPLLAHAVASALTSEGVDVMVHVVDNGSEPAAVVPDDDRVTLHRNEANRGVAPARNQGVAAGSHPLVCLLDSDARLHPTSLAALVDVIVAGETIGLAAPVFAGQRPTDSAGTAPTLWRKAARAVGFTSTYREGGAEADGVREVDFAIGACQVFRREAFDEVGGLDETYFYGPEDVDFCLRLKEAGWRVVQVSAASVDHPPRRRNRKLFTKRGLAHAVAVLRHLRRHR